jgi:peroxiredoxin Q/BCP
MRHFVLAVACVLTAATVHGAELIAPGTAFPAWSLVDDTGQTVSSVQLHGKRYLLWFYPKAMTPGCTAEGQGLRDSYAAFKAAEVAVFGVSFDAPDDNAAFVRAEGFPFRLLSDRDRTLAVAVGAATTREQAMARRISYLIGPDGRVLRAYDNVSPATHARQVLADVTAVLPGQVPQ